MNKLPAGFVPTLPQLMVVGRPAIAQQGYTLSPPLPPPPTLLFRPGTS